jgi:hypothetical protein
LHSIDPAYQKEQELQVRWANLKGAVFMADSDPGLHDLIEKVEIYYRLKR